MGQKNTIITIKDRKRKELGTVRKNMQLVPTDFNNSTIQCEPFSYIFLGLFWVSIFGAILISRLWFGNYGT